MGASAPSSRALAPTSSVVLPAPVCWLALTRSSSTTSTSASRTRSKCVLPPLRIRYFFFLFLTSPLLSSPTPSFFFPCRLMRARLVVPLGLTRRACVASCHRCVDLHHTRAISHATPLLVRCLL